MTNRRGRGGRRGTASVLCLGLLLLGAQVPQDSGHVVVAPAVDSGRTANPELEALTRQVASELRCPVCQGLSINDSPAELAVQMKDLIRDQLASGKSPQDVKDYFIGRYGEWVLLAPEPKGVNLAVYVLPVLALVGGGALLALAVRRWLPRGDRPAFAANGAAAEDLDEELAPRH